MVSSVLAMTAPRGVIVCGVLVISYLYLIFLRLSCFILSSIFLIFLIYRFTILMNNNNQKCALCGSINCGYTITQENQKSCDTTNTEFTIHYCNQYLLHLISEKIWLLHHIFVSLAPEQRIIHQPSNIAVIVKSLYVPTVSASTEHLKPLCRITSLMPKYQRIHLLN